ncbi:MAG: endonuclease MutS2 [Acholeplasmatales bacterium]|nr:endonuclease MutS2 [Acholeplasmatales bacterium]
MYDYNTLELDKVLSMLSNFIITDYAKEKLLSFDYDYSYDEIVKRQKETKEAYDSIVKLSNLPISGLRPVLMPIKRSMQNGILRGNELLDIVKLIDISNGVIRYFKDLENIKLDNPTLNNYVANIVIPKALKSNISLAIGEDGEILDNASRELFTIRRSIKTLENRLKSKLNELLISHAKELTEGLIVQRNNRYCLPVKIEYKNTFKGIVHDISSSQTTAYIEPEAIIEITNSIDTFKAKEKHEEELILKSLSLLVANDGEVLINNLEILTILDIIFAKASMGLKYEYNEASVINEPKFNIKKCRHPLIEKDVCVPVDCNIGYKFDCIVITGPNTGGKTVLLKTIGLLHLMAYMGLMVPASLDSKFGYFDNILVDIGDEQSIEQSLSTFSSHMTKVIKILNNISFNSLVLLDELGSGTDPKEGASLAIAIIEYLKECGSKVIVSTHYSDLKTYAYTTDGIVNASVEFNSETYMPTYRLLIGIPGKSNAIEIAKKLGLSNKIIERSKLELENNSSESSELLSNLEKEMNDYKNKEKDLENNIRSYNFKVEELKREKLELVKKTDKIISDSKKEASKILENAKAEAQKLIDEIKNMSSENFKEHELINLKTKANNLKVDEAENEIFEQNFNVGDFVYIKSYQKYGSIKKIKNDKYTIGIGPFDMEFNKSDLTIAAKPKEEPKKVKKTKPEIYSTQADVGLSLDLRGKRAEEVNDMLDIYISKCLQAHFKEVTIIHGFGMGVVRKMVQEFLKKSPYVKSFRYGGEGEGLNGVTVVTLK